MTGSDDSSQRRYLHVSDPAYGDTVTGVSAPQFTVQAKGAQRYEA
jgi:hypothetical protein